jgi:hypothetical protein
MFPALLIQVFIVLGAAAIILWGVSAWPGLDPTIKQMFRVVVIVAVSFYLLSVLLRMTGPAYPIFPTHG